MPSRSSSTVRVFSPPFDREQLVALLRERLPGLSTLLPVQRAVLFGSWAANRATAFSDIDLLIVYDDPIRDDAYKVVWKHLALRGLEPHVYAKSEASEIEVTLSRMTANGVDLLGSVQQRSASHLG